MRELRSLEGRRRLQMSSSAEKYDSASVRRTPPDAHADSHLQVIPASRMSRELPALSPKQASASARDIVSATAETRVIYFCKLNQFRLSKIGSLFPLRAPNQSTSLGVMRRRELCKLDCRRSPRRDSIRLSIRSQSSSRPRARCNRAKPSSAASSTEILLGR